MHFEKPGDLTSMYLAQTAWQYDDVEHHEMNTVRTRAIGKRCSSCPGGYPVFFQGHSIENGSESGGYLDTSWNRQYGTQCNGRKGPRISASGQ